VTKPLPDVSNFNELKLPCPPSVGAVELVVVHSVVVIQEAAVFPSKAVLTEDAVEVVAAEGGMKLTLIVPVSEIAYTVMVLIGISSAQ
jgi:hypothetical protein